MTKRRRREVAVAALVVVAPALLCAAPALADPYVVRLGDTLTSIAVHAHTSVTDLVARNHLSDPNRLAEGQVIDVPAAVARPAAGGLHRTGGSAPGSDVSAAVALVRTALAGAKGAGAKGAGAKGAGVKGAGAKGAGAVVPTTPASCPPTTPADAIAGLAQPLPKPAITMTVRPGDTVLRIAHRFKVKAADFVAVNRLSDPNRLRAGTVLLVPTRGLPAGITTSYPAVILATPERLALVPVFDAAAAEFSVPADLLKADAWIESAWHDSACSDVGAIGIGQLMPETATWLARDMMGQPTLDPTKPVDNIRMSARMLRWLLDSTQGNLTVTLESYYQGLRSVVNDQPTPTAVAYAVLVQSARARFA